MRRPEEYGVSVRLVQEDGEHVYEARVAELPDVRTYGESFAEAYQGAIEVIATTQEVFAEKGKPFPDVERYEDEFSGRVTLRMSKSLHRCVHTKAQHDGVSLNQWLVEAIACRADGAPQAQPAVYVASKCRHDTGQVGVYIQEAMYVSSAHMANSVVYAVDGVLEAPPLRSFRVPSLLPGRAHHG